MITYGIGRKIGVGFNHPLVLDGRMQFDWQRKWNFARRLTRLRKAKFQWQRALGASAVEAHRRMVSELKPRKRKASKSNARVRVEKEQVGE